MGELGKLPKRVVELACAELLRLGWKMRRPFEQGRSVGDYIKATGGRLATQFSLNLGLDINNDRHRASPRLIVLLASVYHTQPLAAMPARDASG